MTMDSIGEKIKRMREIKGFTQKEIADAIGTSLPNYGRIERDEIELTVNRLEQIAKKMEVSPADIMRLDEGFSVVINNSNDFYVAKTMHLPLLKEKVSELEDRLTKIEQALASQKKP